MQILIVLALISFILVCLIFITSTVLALGFYLHYWKKLRDYRKEAPKGFGYPAYRPAEPPEDDSNPGFSPKDPDWWKQ
jgi:hypothetical protein